MKAIAFTGRMDLASICAMLVAIGGCAGAPSMDTVSPAEIAVNRAIEAKAGEYAPLELRLAQENLDAARQAMSDEEHEQARRLAEAAVTFLNEHPDQTIVIEGHTDSKGSDTYNSDLSHRRAQAVQGFLLSNGIGGERIAASGYGEAYPVASNETAAGRQQNRRVEIVISEHPRQVGVSRQQ